jgi:hypothetical protein
VEDVTWGCWVDHLSVNICALRWASKTYVKELDILMISVSYMYLFSTFFGWEIDSLLEECAKIPTLQEQIF